MLDQSVYARKIAVIGLGYVGLPVAVAFAQAGFATVGFDIDVKRTEELRRGIDRTLEVSDAELAEATVKFTHDVADLHSSNFFIVTVPTPINEAKQPDLSALMAASRTVGKSLKKGDIVVYESTVYPGATEEDCVPVLEAMSGLKCGLDFKVGYSPERINPGDKSHKFKSIRKVVSAQDKEAKEIVAAIYGAVVQAGIYVAESIKVAEAAKVIENTQRDINIAFMNELSEIFRLLEIDTSDVLAAAATKWNFIKFTPGLVGGHCISVDPYYLTHRAERAGYHPQVILSGRKINDSFGRNIARECVRLMLREFGSLGPIVQLGLTFKENVPDLRNSKAAVIVEELRSYGISPQVVDPLASAEEAAHEYGIDLAQLADARPAQAVIVAVAHEQFKAGGWELISKLIPDGRGIVVDVRSILDRATKPDGIVLFRL